MIYSKFNSQKMGTLRKASCLPWKYTALALLVLLTTLSSTASSSASEPPSQQPTSHQHVTRSSYEEEGDVLVLDQRNLHQAIKEFELLMVNFCE